MAKVDYDMAIAASAASSKLERSQKELSHLQERLEIQEQQDAFKFCPRQLLKVIKVTNRLMRTNHNRLVCREVIGYI